MLSKSESGECYADSVNDALDFGVVRPVDSLCLERLDVEGQLFLERLDEE